MTTYNIDGFQLRFDRGSVLYRECVVGTPDSHVSDILAQCRLIERMEKRLAKTNLTPKEDEHENRIHKA